MSKRDKQIRSKRLKKTQNSLIRKVSKQHYVNQEIGKSKFTPQEVRTLPQALKAFNKSLKFLPSYISVMHVTAISSCFWKNSS